MCAVKFLRLEDFLDGQQGGMAVHMEPQGIVFAKVSCQGLFSSILRGSLNVSYKFDYISMNI